MKAAALDILEAAYDLEREDGAWLLGIARAARPIYDRGLGVVAYFSEVGGPGQMRAWGHAGETELEDPAALYARIVARIGPEPMRQLHMLGPFGTTTHVEHTPCPPNTPGAASASGVMGLDAEGRGVCLATWSRPGTVIGPRRGEIALWARIAPHLATASRLRRKLARGAEPEAVLEPDGRVAHAEGDARGRLAREALRDMAVRIDRARSLRRDRGEALELWRCMVDERWTVIDRFERDGRRYVVAYPNAPDPRAALDALTARERAVSVAAALGHSNKVIAYELGTAESTVATLLTRASRKVGASSRVELVRIVRAATTDDDA
jgi:DNA-binding CsgD family transcriptional regulator